MTEHTPTPWRHVELVNDDKSSLTPEDAAEYSANTALNGSTGFYAIQAIKEDGKLYNVCFVGNGPDSIANGERIVRCVNYHDRLVEALRQMYAIAEFREACNLEVISTAELLEQLEQTHD